MQKNSKYLLLGAAFVVSLGAAFLLTRTLKQETQAPVSPAVEVNDSVLADTVVVMEEEPVVEERVKKEEKVAPEPPKETPMGYDEFLRLMINKNDASAFGGRHPKLAKRVVINVKGGDTGIDIQTVRDRIYRTKKWSKNIRILNISYDDRGKVSKVLIDPEILETDDDF